ncbi:hypothetical protein ETAA8_49370 [Anatilimnocola aggregata]|uniref:Uncharacterized protein n=1 Tax=Anatilimnocola aggregata TaxID=2528021 RepID=A0A517YHY4_9BACT|nr:hypothetical protein [Anatilimnocola aggregata]QDU29822.1 hypothetical protein ETAA8_49370 [Anatilimnocola aggregata]
MIKFLCPNGHQLSAPDNLAGKGGKCPKCSSAFMVPTLEELAEAGATPPDSSGAGDKPDSSPSNNGGKSGIASGESGKSNVAAGSKIGMGSQKGSAPSSGVFVFLCPNGHKLNGPATLKGKAGQCPHCGARFVIPEDDEVPPDDEIPTGQAEDDEVPSGEAVEDDLTLGEDEDVVEATVEEVEPDPEPIPPGVHALGYIVGRLWDHRTETTELEIFLTEGEILSPDHYAEILSTGDYGVFALKDADDNFSLSVIPWSAIRRVDLRRVTKLSSGTFR